LTIVGRELREQARHPWTYRLRIYLALTAVAIFALSATRAVSQGMSDQDLGLVLFHDLQAALFAVIWLVVPFLVCDTLSREKREGTLGLLFLTPLRPGGVVAGKTLAHGFRVLALLAVFAPVLAVPWLAGGVGWREYLIAFCIDVASIGLALSAGLLASAVSKQWSWAMVLGPLLALALFCVYVCGYLKCSSVVTPYSTPGSGWQSMFRQNVVLPKVRAVPTWRYTSRARPVEFVLALASGTSGTSQGFGGSPNAKEWLLMHMGLAVASLVLTAGIVRLVAHGLRTSLQSGGYSRWRITWQDIWTRPRVATSRLKRKMRRALDKNPVGWLQQHRASARVTKWAWCLAAVITQGYGLAFVDWNTLPWLHFWLCLLLGVGLAFSAAGSFQVERENGAFELLLVTPLREHDIVWGRLRGLWSQFAPGFAVVLGASIWWSVQGGRFSTSYWSGRQSMPELFCHSLPWAAAASWLAIPAIGLRASLICRTFARAWLLTIGWGFLLPGLGYIFAVSFMMRPSPGFAGFETTVIRALVFAVLTQLLAACGQLFLLHRKLARREFHILPT